MQLSTKDIEELAYKYSTEFLRYSAHCVWGDMMLAFKTNSRIDVERFKKEHKEYFEENERLRLIAKNAQELFEKHNKISQSEGK